LPAGMLRKKTMYRVPDYWLDKPYYSLNAYFQKTLGEKCYKVALDAGLSCPNRDGRTGSGGCIFCSVGGSGDFAVSATASCIETQLREGSDILHRKYTGSRFVAYFQAYTNTYGPVSYLREIYTAALILSEVAGISIATRPDCLGPEVLSLLAELKERFPQKFIWIELGLQTMHEHTAAFIRRGYPLSVFEEAMANLQALSLPVIVHVILGLPFETAEDMYATTRYLNTFSPFGIKFQLLHILKNTALGDMYTKGELPGFTVLSKEEYMDILIKNLELLSPETVVHRVTGDGAGKDLIAPLWSLQKRDVLNTLHRTMRERQTYQGMLYEP